MSARFKEIAGFLKDARVRRDVTQIEVAKHLGYDSPQFVSNWERGLAAPPLAILRKLAKYYKVSEENVFSLMMKDTEAQMRKEFMGSRR